MIYRKFNIGTSIVLITTFVGLSGCSTFSQVGKSARNMTTFGSDKSTAGTDDKLVIPPSLREPGARNTTAAPQQATTKRTTASTPARKATYQANKNYYIVVGTYADQMEALDTFTRLSSIGLKGATMESRKTKTGNLLHMVRLGPYNNQEDIDKAKDNLTSTGLSQFKVVES
ncbi:SPOR domain-containing protein [uncultured Cocleimonas sp.]|uniref:SPOR domain-containing protein n=1 Tax=uncultured Cocleimonas sp. TaxID=1051587 RepID=UPI00261447AF|nr:SPOR domain-containing protein [uncultured Cocleimonas sp.]